MAWFLLLTILYFIAIHLETAHTACFGQSSITPPQTQTNITQIVLIMNEHQLQYIDSFTLNAWSLDLDMVNQTYSPQWTEFNITNMNNLSIADTSIIKSQRYSTVNGITYLLHPPSKSLILYNTTSQTLYKNSNNSLSMTSLPPYPDITSAFCVTNNNTHIFVIGGMESASSFVKFYSTLQIYDINTGEWGIGPNMTTTRLGHGCDYDGDDYIYVYGGWRDIFNYAVLIERYSITENKWEIFMDKTNVIGSDVFRGFSRQCMSTTKYPIHGTTCVEYPNSKDNEFNGEISVINQQDKLAMNTIYKMNNFLGMILYDIDRIATNYSFLLLFGSDAEENAMYSLIDRMDGSMDCYLPGEGSPPSKENTDEWWIFRALAIFLFVFFFLVATICCIWKKWKKSKKQIFEEVQNNDDEMQDIETEETNQTLKQQ